MTEHHTLALACAHVPQGVICLLSALQFHNLTTQNPWQVWLMIERHARTPKLDYPPLRIVRSGVEALASGTAGAVSNAGATSSAGIEEHQIEGVTVGVAGVARTVADCFKYRNKIGLDVALEALRECLRERRVTRP